MDPEKKILVGFMALRNRGERIVGELVVVAIVSVGGGALGKIAKIGFVLFFEESVLGGKTLGQRLEVLSNERSRSNGEQY